MSSSSSSSTNNNQQNYSQYFLTEFTDLFKQFTVFCESNIKSEKVLQSLNQVSSILDSLNYEKIATKYANNNVLQQHLIFLKQNNFEKKCFVTIMNDNCWKIVPAMNVCLVFLHAEPAIRSTIYDMLYQLYSCSCMYVKAVENETQQYQINNQISNAVGTDGFNPYEFIGGDNPNNITIEEMFKNAQQCSYMPHEMLLKMMEGMNGNKIGENFENMDEVQLKQQTEGLTETLNSDDFDPESAKFLQDIIGEIYPELINIKNTGTTRGMTDRESADLIGDVAKRLANKMIAKNSLNGGGSLDPEKLFDSTQQLAKNYIDNPMVLGVMNMFKQHIISQKKQLDKELKATKRHKRISNMVTGTTANNRVVDDEITNLLGALD